ncbi:MAG: glycosyltransferase family 2 protein [Bacteroidales bacterium]|nr:glycosyltransferase family 2 protein [Bacteroidales bacterium]MBN2756565.1 glycosyltransferase family 2 protein [Bacteroidales bacterium]
MNNKIELIIVMPVYNEEKLIPKSVESWINELNKLNIKYEFHIYNDGSTDKTKDILDELQNTDNQLFIHNKNNSGHGSTILNAYKNSINCKWIFQTDSDNEINAENFKYLWEKRENFDFLIGKRINKKQSFSRKLISSLSRITVNIFYGNKVYDVNSPFRLMRTESFAEIFNKIPDNTFAPNLIISGITCVKKLRIFETEVNHTNRKEGTVSLKKLKLLKAALLSFYQTIRFRFN